MYGNKRKVESSHTVPKALYQLWIGGFFIDERRTEEIMNELSRLGCNPTMGSLRMALSRAKFLTKRGEKKDRRYIQRTASSATHLGKDRFPNKLVNALTKEFTQELHDLRLNYGKSGTCTAFLLRKILEKLIFITFAKNGMGSKLKDQYGRFLGLDAMLNMAAGNVVDGIPFMMPKTAKEVEGIKFLGDASAHNPLVNVDMEMIEPVLPYIVTAYTELAKKL